MAQTVNCPFISPTERCRCILARLPRGRRGPLRRQTRSPKNFPYHLPRATQWALLALALGARLGLMPEYRSKPYLARQQDAAAIKDAGKRIVEVTRRSLERRPPVLGVARKAVETVQELGLRLDQNPTTRNDALKDLANVAETLKSQLKELGQTYPAFKALEKEARETPPGENSGSPPRQGRARLD